MSLKDLLSPPKELTVDEFYQLHKAEILKLVSTEHLRTDIRNLKYEITSASTKRYYSFPEKMQIPFMRLAKSMEYMDWLKNGISAEDFDRIRGELTVCLAHIKSKSKEADTKALKSGMLVAELDRRRVQALPYYVLINLCANFLIREDEDPQVISSQIHSEKCDDLQKEIESGNNAFFLTIPQLKPLSVVQTLSLPELTQYLRELKKEAEQDQILLKAYLSWTEALNEKPTSSKV